MNTQYSQWLNQLEEAFVNNHGFTKEEAKKHVSEWNWSTYYERDWTPKETAADDCEIGRALKV